MIPGWSIYEFDLKIKMGVGFAVEERVKKLTHSAARDDEEGAIGSKTRRIKQKGQMERT